MLFDFGPFLVFWTRSKVVQKDLKGIKMVNPSVLCPFGAKKIQFYLKWFKRVKMGPKRSQMVKNTWVDHFSPFWDNYGTCSNYQKGSRVEKIIVPYFWYTLYFPLGIMTISRHLMVSRKQEISPVADLSPPGLFLVLVSKW